MLRVMLGWLFILHGIAHAYAGTWSSSHRAIWPLTIVWSIASIAYLVAGIGILRAPGFRHWWKPAAVVATAASMLMMIGYGPPLGMTGFAVDLVLWIAAIGALQPRFDDDISVVDSLGVDSYRHPRWVKAGWFFGTAMIVYAAAALLLRPMFVRWGTTADERVAALPGDEVHPLNATYRIDHAITIHAPASAIWPWLVQLGQDRGGFYSYAWLERAIGDRVQNADRVHPEWQQRAVGDTVFAAQSDYLGGLIPRPGWRVNVLERERVIGLENWGTFVLVPIDSHTTRLIVRSRGMSPESVRGLALAPVNVFVFEPMHFIMEQAMLRGIRDRAERGGFPDKKTTISLLGSSGSRTEGPLPDR